MSLVTVRPSVSDKMPADLNELLTKLRQEILPVLQRLRESNNSQTTGLVMSGNGIPLDVPTTSRAIYIQLDGGAATTLWVYEGAGWVAK